MQSLYILNKMRQIPSAALGDNEVNSNNLDRLHDIKRILNVWGTTLIKKSRDWHSFQEISSTLDKREGFLKIFNYADDRIDHMLLKAMIARKCFDFHLAERTVAQLKALRNTLSKSQQLELALEECSLLYTNAQTQTKALSLCRQVFKISKNSLISAESGVARKERVAFTVRSLAYLAYGQGNYAQKAHLL